jgi:CheY-like chemotaxis protein
MRTPADVRLTQRGKQALRENRLDGAAVAAEHRRILSLVEFQGCTAVVRGFLGRHPDALIDKWFTELEQLRLIEGTTEPPEVPLRFSGAGAVPVPHLLPQDEKLLADQAWAASNLLSVAGAYVARERVQNRAFARKAIGDTEILIVEDDPDQGALAARRLGAAGYRVRQADSAQALLQTLSGKAPPDLLLLDVMLPDGDGFDILGNLRLHRRFCLLPVVMLTIKSDPADIQAGIALGADAYVTKPYDAQVLTRTIAQVLRGAGG